MAGMVFEGRVASPNGEDYLYVFYNRLSGVYVLLPYNLIEQRVGTPVTCNGYSLFDSGELVYFKAQAEPQKHPRPCKSGRPRTPGRTSRRRSNGSRTCSRSATATSSAAWRSATRCWG